jgi:biopolymer transport protein ExbB
MQNLNVIELMRQGWLATYPLLVCSVIMVALLGERIFAFIGIASSARQVTRLIVPPLTIGDFGAALSVCNQKMKCCQARLYHSILSETTALDPALLSEQLEESRYEGLQNLKQNIWILGTIGSSAPFIGLFGTVVGIIKSFHNMSIAGSGGFSVVAGGISEALVATAAGLVVGITSVVAYNYLQVRVARINAELKINHSHFIRAYNQGRTGNGGRHARRKDG